MTVDFISSIKLVGSHSTSRIKDEEMGKSGIDAPPWVCSVPTISFVVPLFNHLFETQAMLASLQASLPDELDYEIILADDASSESMVTWLKSLRDPHIKTVLCEINRGYAATNNAGVRLAKGEILGLLNNDLLFESGWLEPMLDALKSPLLNAGLVGNIQYRVADGTVDHAGVILGQNGQFHHTQTIPETPHVKALAVTGACMLLRKADFLAAGGLDEQFVNGCEDIDLCFKLRASGKAIYLASESRIHHHVSLSRKSNTLQDLRNSQLLFSRWRNVIKFNLSKIWRGLLAAGPQTYAELISGELSADFIGTPHAAAGFISESMLSRERAFWARKLDEVDTSYCPKISFSGLHFSVVRGGYVLESEAEFVVEGLSCARNFFVCGLILSDISRSTRLTINVNSLQRLSISLKGERNFNAGIVDPLMLPEIANRFWVKTTGALVITHLVLDDREVNLKLSHCVNKPL